MATNTVPCTSAIQETKQLVAYYEQHAQIYRMLASFWFQELTLDQLRALSSTSLAASFDNEENAGYEDAGKGGSPDGVSVDKSGGIANPTCEEAPSFEHAEALMLKGAQLIDESLCRVTAKTRSTLAVDYARCMLAAGSYEQRCATPYESVFTSKLGLMMQEARDDMFNLYRTWSVEANRDLSIPEDHLAFELEFAAYVCDEVARCLKNGNIEAAEKASDAFEAFVTNHLANWVGKVCSALEGMAQTSFYQGVAKLTWGFIQEEFLGFKNDLEEAA